MFRIAKNGENDVFTVNSDKAEYSMEKGTLTVKNSLGAKGITTTVERASRVGMLLIWAANPTPFGLAMALPR